MENTPKLTEQEKDVAIARLEVLSPTLHFSSGNDGTSYSRDEIIELIRANAVESIEFVNIELDFMRAMGDGSLMKQLVSEE